jgi:hypothetical protein
VAGAILDVAVKSWTPMLNPQGMRNLAFASNSKNPDGVVTTGTGQFVGVYDAPFANVDDFALIEDTVSTGQTFSLGQPSYNSELSDLRPTDTALSATEVIALNWTLQGPLFLLNSPTGLVWSLGKVTAGTDPLSGDSDVVWSLPQSLTAPGAPEQNMFPEVASKFVTALVIAPSLTLEPPSITNPAGTSHTVTATVTQGGQPANGISVNFTVTGANTASGSSVTGATAPGQCQFTYTGMVAGTDTITATATVNNRTLTATATATFVAPEKKVGRMTGDAVKRDGNNNVSYGFELRCDPSTGSNSLQIRWSGSNGQAHKFNLERVVSSTCTDDPNISPGDPPVDYDTIQGNGIGWIDDAPGATISYTFKDAGEPGAGRDIVQLEIKSANGTIVLSIQGTIERGNHQARRN